MPVCVAGMHRAGTSMVARLLNLCGLYLGDQKDFLSKAPDNPAGFWEHTAFLDINEQLLRQLGGTWNDPPSLSLPSWTSQPELNPLKSKAKKLARSFMEHSYWGWKDPRTSLTFPFWQTIIPGLKMVICLRSPLEVAESLRQREVRGLLDSESHWVNAVYRLWHHYYQEALQNAPSGQRIVIHYESFFVDPERELRRLLAFVGITVSPFQFEEAIETIQPQLYRQQRRFDDLLISDVPLDTLSFYTELCQAAGAVFQQTNSAQAYADLTATATAQMETVSPVVFAALQDRARAFRQQEEEIKRYQTQTARVQRRLVDREKTIQFLYKELDQRAETIHTLTQQISELEHWQTEVTSRFSWQMLEKFWTLRETVVPKGQVLDRLLSPLLKKFKAVSDGNDREVGTATRD